VPEPPSSQDTLAADPQPRQREGDLDTLAAERLPEPAPVLDTDATIAEPSVSGPAQPPARVTAYPRAPRIGRYAVLRKLGEGGMGVVYAAYDEQLDRKVALKLLRGKAGGEARKHRLVREAQGLARLSHPNVVQVYDDGEQGGDAFIVMEYVDGTTLSDWLKTPHTRREILAVFDAAGRGLAAAHHKGLVHRDFKPDNVMITGEGVVKVMDFGLVHEASSEAEAQVRVGKMHESSELGVEQSLRISALSTDLTATGALMGTPAYMSPEQFGGRRTDARTDQFSFCVALWEALCGERPFAGGTFGELCLAVTQGQRREPPRGKLTRHLRRTLERGLAGKVEARWPSMDALLAELAKNPARRILIASLVLAPIVLALGGWQAWRIDRAQAHAEALAACEAEAGAIAADWTAQRRHAIAERFHATGLPYADDAWLRSERLLDTYASEWTRVRGETCVAALADEPDTTSPALDAGEVAVCLDERRATLQALLAVLDEADAELVPQAIQTVAGLPLVGTCVDAVELAGRMRPPAEHAAEIQQLRAELHALEVLVSLRPATAREQAPALLERARALAWPPIEAEAEFMLGHADYRLGKLDTAVPALDHAFFVAGEQGHDRLALDAALMLAEAATKREDYAMSLHWSALAQMLIVRLGLEHGQEAGQLATARGNALNNQGKLDEARAAHEQARTIWTALYGPEHHVVAIAWANLGITQRKQGNYADALAAMQESLRIRELMIGPNHPRIAESIYNMGNVLRQQGKDAEALALFERALDIWKTALGPRHRNVALALNNIGSFYFGKNELERALDYYVQARDIWIEALGPEHSDVALALNNIGNVEYTQEHYDEALVAYREAITIVERNKGPDHPDVALSLGNVVMALRDRGDYDEALAASDRTLAILEGAHGPDHPDVANALEGRAGVLAKLGRNDEARAALVRALAIDDQKPGSPVERASMEFELAKLEWDAGARERARELVGLARERCVAAEAKEALVEIDAWLADR
jgi:tetratricopeptide (TPR) repeat protein/predicted Ser/Thr protein kinase